MPKELVTRDWGAAAEVPVGQPLVSLPITPRVSVPRRRMAMLGRTPIKYPG